jgi:hypothetical protein
MILAFNLRVHYFKYLYEFERKFFHGIALHSLHTHVHMHSPTTQHAFTCAYLQAWTSLFLKTLTWKHTTNRYCSRYLKEMLCFVRTNLVPWLKSLFGFLGTETARQQPQHTTKVCFCSFYSLHSCLCYPFHNYPCIQYCPLEKYVFSPPIHSL